MYFIIKLLLDGFSSLTISAVFFVLMLWVTGNLVYWYSFRLMFPIILIFPFQLIADDTRNFIQQRNCASTSEVLVQSNHAVPVEITIQKNVYCEFYHVHSVTEVKKTWKGICVQGRITAEYIYDPEIGRHDTEELDRILIPPYFNDMESIAQNLGIIICNSSAEATFRINV